MVFSYNWLKDYIKKMPEPKRLAELLTMHFAEVEELKKVGRDFILNVDIRPNRASDCFSYLGIAREIAAIANSKLQIPDSKLKEDQKLKAKNFVSLKVESKQACPRYTARVLEGVRVGPSPSWLKERLKICGLRPINNIVDIANYVMLETGQPLHAFDGKKLEGGKIIVRFARSRERIVTLDEQKFELASDILVIADEKRPVAIAGIKGGKLPEIDKKTKTVIIESANFNPQVIRNGSKNLNLKTDASLRFEHGIDPNLTEFAVNRTAYLIQKTAGGKVAKGLVDFYPQKSLPRTIKLDLNYLEKLLGKEIPEVKIKSIFKNLGFQVLGVKSRQLTVRVPTRRLDISLPEDLIEEAGRIYGYEKIEPYYPLASLILPKKNLSVFWENMVKNILKETGFTEVYNYSFFSEKEAKLFGYGDKELVELENPLSQEQKYLRASLIPYLLKNAEKNLRNYKRLRIFELGKIFRNPKSDGEKRMLTGLISVEDFYQLKGIVDLLLKSLGVANFWYDEHKPTPEESKLKIWHQRKSAEIKVDGQEIGFLGEISPRILNALEIKEKLVLFDIDFEKLSQYVSEEHEYRPISRFPSVVRDIAVLVPRSVKVVEILNKINLIGKQLVRDIDLFDMYEGEELPQGKKNLAFHIIYQAEDRTLSSEEVDEIQDKIIKVLEKNLGWQVRK